MFAWDDGMNAQVGNPWTQGPNATVLNPQNIWFAQGNPFHVACAGVSSPVTTW